MYRYSQVILHNKKDPEQIFLLKDEFFLSGAGLFSPANAVSFGILFPCFSEVGFGICKIIIVLRENTQIIGRILGLKYFFKTRIVEFHRRNPEVLKISISL
jgi:hypothetical protein